MNISCIRVLSKLLSRSRQLYYLHLFYPRTVIRKLQDYHLSYVNQHPTDYKYKYKVAFNHLVLCALFCRSQIWLLHSHPTFPVNTAQVAYLSTHLVSKVCGFDDITKQAYFNNPGQQLDFYQKLITYQFRFIRECLNRTSRGFFKAASGNGASMMKFPLSVTTGPAVNQASCVDSAGRGCVRMVKPRWVPQKHTWDTWVMYVRVGTGKLTLVPKMAEFFR